MPLTYIADDHQIVAEGIASLLRSTGQFDEVRLFSDGKSLWNACKAQKPSLVFLDYEMPGWTGMETLKQLKHDFPDVPVLILSMNVEKGIIESCIQHGANGYMSKDSTPDELAEALKEAQNGETYYSREILKVLAGVKTIKTPAHMPQVSLSVREREILKLICDGLTPKEIADKLYLSKRTVDTHKNNIMQKLDVSTVGKLISLTLQNNLLK